MFLEDLLFAERMRSAEQSVAASARGYLATGNVAFLQRLEETESTLAELIRDMPTHIRSSEGKQLFDRVSLAADEYQQAQRRLLVDTKDVGRLETSQTYEREIVPLRRHLEASINTLIDYKTKV